MDEHPSLTIYDFRVDYEGLFLDFKYETDNLNIEEFVSFKFSHQKEHTYQIRYCDKAIN